MIKRWGIKSGIVLIILGTLFYMGMLHARQIPATVLDGLKGIKRVTLELLATSEYSDSVELKKRLESTSEALKKFVSEHGANLGLGDDSSSSPSSTPASLPTVTPVAASTPAPAPAIIVAKPPISVSPAPVAPVPDATDATAQEIIPEPPAAALGSSIAPGGETIQPPAVLAAPAPTGAVAGAVVASVEPVVTPGMPDIQPLGEAAVPVVSVPAPVPGLGIPVVPDVAGIAPIADLNTLPSLGEIAPMAPAAPVVPGPGMIAPIAPLQPNLGAVPVPMLPAPGALPATSVMPGLPGLQALPPLTYHELESLDGEMNQLMAMRIPEAPVFFNIQPFATVSAFDQEAQEMELMSVAMQDSPAIVMDQTLDDLNLSDLTLAGLE